MYKNFTILIKNLKFSHITLISIFLLPLSGQADEQQFCPVLSIKPAPVKHTNNTQHATNGANTGLPCIKVVLLYCTMKEMVHVWDSYN